MIWFEYGETKDLGNTSIPNNANLQYGTKNIMHTINFKANSNKIYYRVVASNKNGISYGNILEYDTLDIASVLSAILSILAD